MRRILLQAALAAGLIGPAAAADLGTGEPIPAITEPGGFEARWQFAMAAYLWMPGIDGTVGVAGLEPVDVDVDFTDILENLEFGFMAVTEARYDRFGIFSDLMYTKLSVDGTGPLGFFEADVTQKIFTGTVMGEYRVIEQGKTSLDIMAGARIWWVSGDLDVTATVGDPPLGFSADGDKSWVDPMIGVKTRIQGNSPFYLNGWAMIGGFGVSSDIDWDLYGGVGYEVTDSVSLVAGYRALGVDYSDDGFVMDIVQQGPVIGGVFRF
jgi:opacity protein-like surface antigen